MTPFFNRPEWPKFDRTFFQFLLALSLVAFSMLAYAFFYEASFVFPLEKQVVPELIKIRLFQYLNAFGDFSPEINSLINFQKYKAANFEIPILAGLFFQPVFFMTIVLLTVACIRITNWMFYVGLSLIILFLVFFNVQEFGIFGEFENYFLYVSIFIAAGAVLYLRNFQYDKSFRFHLVSSLFIWGLIWAAILLFGEGNHKLFQLSNFGFGAAIIISSVFIILIGHEPIHIFFTMISYSSNSVSKGRIVNFIILALLYLGNIGLSYMKNIGFIDWDIIYTPFQLLLIFAIICGFYGFPKRFHSQSIFGNKSFIAILYASLSLFTMSFLAFAYFSGHDAIIDILEDATLYSQLGMGTIFFFYLIVNFGDLLQQNVKAYKVAYKPSRFPLMTAFIGGIVIMVAMFMRSNMFPYYQAKGIIYSGMADNYLLDGDEKMAMVFYEEASVFAAYNSRTTANQAFLYKKQGNRQAAVLSLKKSIFKNPEPVHFIDLAQQFENNDKYFDALFSLQEGVDKFPESEEINNNLGLLYAKAKAYDSAFIYFNRSDEESRERNLSAMLSKVGNFNPDSLPPLDEKDFSEMANRVSIYNRQKKTYQAQKDFSLLSDSVIDFDEYSFFYNTQLNRILSKKDIHSDLVDKLISMQVSDDYLRDLYLLRALQNFNEGNISNAISDFESSVNFSGMTAPYISDIAASVLMSIDLDEKALPYIERAARAAYGNSPLKLLSCYVELGDKESARFLVNNNYLRKLMGDSSYKKWEFFFSEGIDFEDTKEMGELFMYSYFKFHPDEWNKGELIELPLDFKNEKLHNEVAAEILDILISKNDHEEILAFYSRWKNKLSSHSLLDEKFMRYLYKNGYDDQYITYFKDVNKKSLYFPLLKAWNEKLNNNMTAYEESAKIAIRKLGYDEDVIVLKVDLMFRNNNPDSAIYDILVDALQVYPENIKLKKSYVLQAARMGLEAYAESELEELKDLIPGSDYKKFIDKYQAVLEEHLENPDW